MSKKRSPDFHVHAMNKETNEKARVGAGWQNEDGTISIVLNSFVKLESSPKLLITLFPPIQAGREEASQKEPF